MLARLSLDWFLFYRLFAIHDLTVDHHRRFQKLVGVSHGSTTNQSEASHVHGAVCLLRRFTQFCRGYGGLS